MPSDLPAETPNAGIRNALVYRQLSDSRENLLEDGAELTASDLDKADAAGLQLLVSALLQGNYRVKVDLRGRASGDLWARLGLDDLADAEPIYSDGILSGLSLVGNPAL